jgi:hypothetical protein
MNAPPHLRLAHGRAIPGVAAVGVAVTAAEHFVAIVRELLERHRAGKLPALWVDADVIRIPWPPDQRETFRTLSLTQAKRILTGVPIEHVLEGRRRQRSVLVRKAEPWPERRAEYLHRKSA